jgi:8-oxo-dGTP pyrophosphatase MutT (NUDIX family)
VEAWAALEQLRGALAAHRPRLATPAGGFAAAVAAIVSETAGQLHLLFIERSQHPGDPWSGHLAFPGGRVEPQDGGPRAAAEREVQEETGLDLGGGELLGRLDDLAGVHQRVVVSTFVYFLPRPGDPVLNSEVQAAFWTPLSHLVDPARRRVRSFPGTSGQPQPALAVLAPDRPVLWGITYRLTCRLLAFLGHSLPEVADPA